MACGTRLNHHALDAVSSPHCRISSTRFTKWIYAIAAAVLLGGCAVTGLHLRLQLPSSSTPHRPHRTHRTDTDLSWDDHSIPLEAAPDTVKWHEPASIVEDGPNKLVVQFRRKRVTLLLHNASSFLGLASKRAVRSPRDVVGILRHLYRQQHGRRQPPGFDHWWRFAVHEGCMLDGYEQIEADIKPFRELYRGAMPAAVLEKAARQTLMQMVTIRNGTYSSVVVPNMWTSQHIVDHCAVMVERFVHLLPDMDIAVNSLDQPRVWMEAVSDTLEAQLQANKISALAAFHEWGCRATPELRAAQTQLGLFVSQDYMSTQPVHELLPIFSACNIPTCFYDILIPTFWTMFRNRSTKVQDNKNAICLGDTALRAQVPLWADKKAKLVWRGSSTGGFANVAAPGEARPRYMNMHRQRLVTAAKEFKSELLDVAFTEFVQCSPEACQEMEEGFGKAPRMTIAEMFSHKYQLVVGGNSFAERLPRFLCSDSLIFMTNILGEWYHRWLQPYVHFVPVKPDYSDLLTQVQWAMEHDEQAQQIVRNANDFVLRYLRAECIECYAFRLLLEYAESIGASRHPA